jgi:hypothetical protein
MQCSCLQDNGNYLVKAGLQPALNLYYKDDIFFVAHPEMAELS